MPQYFKPFLLGVLCTIAAVAMILWPLGYDAPSKQADDIRGEEKQAALAISEDTVSITSLPSFRSLNGINVPFRGKKRFVQGIAGRYAQNITIAGFRASGENAYKSAIIITWEDGSIELVPAGTANVRFPPEKRAKEIIVQGYSVHERKVFRDSARDGVLNWEIIYEPVE